MPTPEWNYLDDVRWLGDGRGFIVSARETEASPYQLWHVAYPDGATRRITHRPLTITRISYCRLIRGRF